mmetsp:Transcript_150/g.355  ORF Transcript_150/g.355 Transcript_150/m.355 type:complete len:257 (+) Transcript_150:2-772(+)
MDRSHNEILSGGSQASRSPELGAAAPAATNGGHDHSHSTRPGNRVSSATDDSLTHRLLETHVSDETPGGRSTAGRARERPQNMNLQAAYIHALGDLIQSVGVLIAAGIIWWRPEYLIADPICTFLFSILVIYTTISILREATNVLMEGTPTGIDVAAVTEDLLSIPGVEGLHDLHIWSLNVGTPALAVHLHVESEVVAKQVLRSATKICQRRHNILHTTIQTDFEGGKRACETSAHTKCASVDYTGGGMNLSGGWC